MSASEMRACMVVVVVMMMVAGCSGDCALEEEVDWGSYGYFQTCRAHHIKQALQVMKPSYIYISHRNRQKYNMDMFQFKLIA